MSHVIVHDVSDIARQRIARQQQIEALPPGPERIARNLWVPWRRPWVHAAYAGTLGARVGPEPVELRALKRAALEQGLPLEEVEALTMDEVLVTPDFASATIAGQTVQVRYGTARESEYSERLKAMKPGVITGWIHTSVTIEDGSIIQAKEATSEAVEGPIIAENVTIRWDSSALNRTLLEVEIGKNGSIYAEAMELVEGDKTIVKTLRLAKWTDENEIRIKLRVTKKQTHWQKKMITAFASMQWRELVPA